MAETDKWNPAFVWDQASHTCDEDLWMIVHPSGKWNIFSHFPTIYTVNWQQIFLCGVLKVGKIKRGKKR